MGLVETPGHNPSSIQGTGHQAFEAKVTSLSEGINNKLCIHHVIRLIKYTISVFQILAIDHPSSLKVSVQSSFS